MFPPTCSRHPLHCVWEDWGTRMSNIGAWLLPKPATLGFPCSIAWHSTRHVNLVSSPPSFHLQPRLISNLVSPTPTSSRLCQPHLAYVYLVSCNTCRSAISHYFSLSLSPFSFVRPTSSNIFSVYLFREFFVVFVRACAHKILPN